MSPTERSIYIRLRNTLERRGYTLKKSRRRDPLALDYGTYWILDSEGRTVAGGENGFSLEEAAEWVDSMGGDN